MGRSSVPHLTAREGDQRFRWAEDIGQPCKPQVQDETHVDGRAPAGTGRVLELQPWSSFPFPGLVGL